MMVFNLFIFTILFLLSTINTVQSKGPKLALRTGIEPETDLKEDIDGISSSSSDEEKSSLNEGDDTKKISLNALKDNTKNHSKQAKLNSGNAKTISDTKKLQETLDLLKKNGEITKNISQKPQIIKIKQEDEDVSLVYDLDMDYFI